MSKTPRDMTDEELIDEWKEVATQYDEEQFTDGRTIDTTRRLNRLEDELMNRGYHGKKEGDEYVAYKREDDE